MTRRDQLIDQSNRTDAIIFLSILAICILIVVSGLGCASVKYAQTKIYADSVKATKLIPPSYWAELDSLQKAATDTPGVQHSQVSQTTVKDSTARVLSTTKTTKGLGLYSWVGLIAALLTIYLKYK